MEKIKGVISMTDLVVTIVEDAIKDKSMEIAKGMLKDKVSVDFVMRHTHLDESTIRQLQKEIDNE